jgi:hypothetical protein
MWRRANVFVAALFACVALTWQVEPLCAGVPKLLILEHFDQTT